MMAAGRIFPPGEMVAKYVVMVQRRELGGNMRTDAADAL